jgi:DNA invertase Pin-like site-specific DNA recombinase
MDRPALHIDLDVTWLRSLDPADGIGAGGPQSLETPSNKRGVHSALAAPLWNSHIVGGAFFMKVAIYARTSSEGQTPANQIDALREVGRRLGWQIIEVFVDHGISGAKGRRPGLDRLLKGVNRRAFDLVAVWSVDRLGRSLSDLLALLAEFNAKGVGLYLHQQGLDTTTPAGRTMFQVLGIFAEFERAMLVDRVKAGLARARASGKRLGRPRLPDEVVTRIRHELQAGRGIHSTAKRLGVGAGSVQRIRAELRASLPAV